MQTINLDISRKHCIPPIYAKQGDVGRKFRIVFVESGLTYEIPDSAVFSVWYSGNSGEGNYTTVGDRDAITINKNEVIVELITQMLSNPGGGNLCLVLSSKDGDQIGTWNIPYTVEGLPGMDSPEAEQYYTALSEVASKAAESAVIAKQAVEYVDSKFKGKAGLIYPLATNTVPNGFLLCDGAEYSRTEYADLFEAIGTIYGAGDGESTFNVPNLSTRVPVGTGEGYALGATGGEEKHTLTVDEMPAHKHALTPLLRGDSAAEYTTGQYTTILTADNLVAPKQTFNVHTSVYAGDSLANGGNQPHNIMQPYTVVNYIISTGKEMEFVVGGPVGGGASVELDTTLTQEGKAADAKAVGDKLGDIDTALDGINVVGRRTEQSGEIFGDYDSNAATERFAASFGSKTRASGIGAIAIGVGSEAQAEASVAGGTTNESHIKDVAGVDIGILSDDMVTETLGERGIRLRDNLKATSASIASGVASISYGTGARGYTALSTAFGVGTESGSKGFYIHKVTVPENGGNITISLTTEHKPYYKYSLLGATIEKNKTASWGDPTAKQLLSALEVGDIVNIILKKPYCLCESIVGVDTENGVITLTNTGGITKQNVEDATVFTDLVTAEGAMLALVPYQFSVAVPAKPDVGTVELHSGSLATGLGSIAAGTLSQAHGKMNLAAGQYGFVAGQNNVAGYCAFASGENNRALGYNSRAEGIGTIASGTASYAGGYNTKASGRRSFAFGYRAIATGDNAVAIGNGSKAVGTNAFAGGTKDTEANGAYSFAYGSNVKATKIGSVAFGAENTVGGLYSIAQGAYNTVDEGRNYANVFGFHNRAVASAQTVFGQYNAIDSNALLVVGGGKSETERKNVFVVKKNGDAHFAGKLYFDGIAAASRNTLFTTRTESFEPTLEEGDYPGQIWRVLTDGSITSVYMYIGLSGPADGEEPCWIKLK